MGLNLEVGILADLKEADSEGYSYHAQTFARLNSFLQTLGLPEHHEPETCPVWSGEMFGYSGLHNLRRFAAHLVYVGMIPSPGDANPPKDPVLQKYYRDFFVQPGFLAKLFGRKQIRPKEFSHLINHSDAEGYYLPFDFPEVLFPPDRFKIPGGMIGSTHRLHAECLKLREALQIPVGLEQQSEEVTTALETQGSGHSLWQKYAIETFSCLGLLEACAASLENKAAIVFT